MSIEHSPGSSKEQPVGLRHSMAALKAQRQGVTLGNELQEASMAELWNLAVRLDAEELAANQSAQRPEEPATEPEL